MRFYTFISAILHPIVMPTIGVILYFILTPIRINKEQEYAVLSIVFIATYIVPLLLLFLLKSLGYIKSFQVKTIRERKIPLYFMIVLFYLLGKIFFDLSFIRDIGYLFYGTSLGLTFVFCLFFAKIKTSLHLLSMGNAIGFFLLLSLNYIISITFLIVVLILLSGTLASARLHLKAHVPREVCLGFFIGILSQFLVYFLL